MMSKMKEAIEILEKNQETVQLYVPGVGYTFGKVVSLEDDVVTIAPENRSKVALHYTHFSAEID